MTQVKTMKVAVDSKLNSELVILSVIVMGCLLTGLGLIHLVNTVALTLQ